MQNEIVKNSIVTLQYTVRDPEGAVIDDGQHPLVYLHGGYDGIFPLLDKVSDEPTADLLTQRMQVHEKTAWMLRALLEA